MRGGETGARPYLRVLHAYSSPVALCVAAKTRPKAPLPSSEPIAKSSSEAFTGGFPSIIDARLPGVGIDCDRRLMDSARAGDSGDVGSSAACAAFFLTLAAVDFSTFAAADAPATLSSTCSAATAAGSLLGGGSAAFAGSAAGGVACCSATNTGSPAFAGDEPAQPMERNATTAGSSPVKHRSRRPPHTGPVNASWHASRKVLRMHLLRFSPSCWNPRRHCACACPSPPFLLFGLLLGVLRRILWRRRAQ